MALKSILPSVLRTEAERKPLKAVVFIFVFSLILFRAFNVSMFDEGVGRNSVRGDAYSDLNTYSTALFYRDFPLSEAKGLPVWFYKGHGDTTGIQVYTHYPAIPDLAGAFYSRLFNSENESTMRLIPILWSMLFFFLVFRSLEEFLPDPSLAFVSACLLVLSNYFIAWGDNLHKHGLEELLKWTYILLLLRYFRKPSASRWLPVWLGLIFILIANISYEPLPYLGIATVGFSWVFTRRIITPFTVCMGLMPVIGFGLHLYQNYLYFGSWDLVMADMKHAAADRTGGIATGEMQRALGWKDYLEIPFLWFNRMERFYLIPGWSFLVLAILAMKAFYRSNRQLFQLLLVLAFCSVCWSFLMSQHYYIHSFTCRHWGLFFALTAGYGLFEYVKWMRTHWAGKAVLPKVLHVLFIAYTVSMALSQQVWDLYIRYGFGYPLFK